MKMERQEKTLLFYLEAIIPSDIQPIIDKTSVLSKTPDAITTRSVYIKYMLRFRSMCIWYPSSVVRVLQVYPHCIVIQLNCIKLWNDHAYDLFSPLDYVLTLQVTCDLLTPIVLTKPAVIASSYEWIRHTSGIRTISSNWFEVSEL